MIEIDFYFVCIAFIGGILMFLAPCTLPLVPGYLGFISGVKQEDFKTLETKKHAQKKVLKSALFFVIGFSIIFILFGILAGLFGRQLAIFEGLVSRVGGVLIIFFGLFMLGVFNIQFLNQDKKIKMPVWLTLGTPTSSFMIGVIFAVGWTPCIGPILASILLLASTTGGVVSGALLLAVFSLGLGVPFLLIAFFYTKATIFIARTNHVAVWVSRIGGIFLIAIGILLLTDNFQLFIEWGYKLFDALNYRGTEMFEYSFF